MKLLGYKLLTKEEFNTFKESIPAIGNSWWLISKDEENNLIDYVDYGHSTNHCGIKPDTNKLDVRPFLLVDVEDYIGKNVKFANKNWLFSEDRTIAYCIGSIGKCTFDELEEFTKKWFDENKNTPFSDRFGEIVS